MFFAYQIYCDFSGYSDIAIGSARVLGFRLMENFRSPYHSRSISEFWQRWHISLSTWFRDYVYIPLGGNRVARRAGISEPPRDVRAQRPVARRELDVRRVGRLNGVYLVVRHPHQAVARSRVRRSAARERCRIRTALGVE